MLTGLINPSEGSEATIFGIDLFRDQSKVRQLMGVCPQHDILFPYLTCTENLELF